MTETVSLRIVYAEYLQIATAANMNNAALEKVDTERCND